MELSYAPIRLIFKGRRSLAASCATMHRYHSLLVCVYFVGTEVGSDTMRAERELYLRREETLRDEVTVVGGG